MTRIAQPTATPAARYGMGTKRAAVTPTSADMMLPPTTDQGCANGLAGTAKISTAEAPIGATSNGSGSDPCSAIAHTRLVSATPITPQYTQKGGHAGLHQQASWGKMAVIFSDYLQRWRPNRGNHINYNCSIVSRIAKLGVSDMAGTRLSLLTN